MYKRNKRGISDIIATLLLVLLAIVIIGIVWLIVSNIISSANTGISAIGGVTLNLRITQASKNANNLSVTVQRQPGAGNLSGINFVLYDGTTYETIRQNTALDVYQGQTFTLVPQRISSASAQTVSVAPIFPAQNGQQVGGITDTYTFVNNTGGGTGPGGGGNQGNNSNNSCIPLTCAQLNYQCGSLSDGCGGNLDCGTCGTNEFCNTLFQCQLDQMVNSGTLTSVWPIPAPTFFDSLNLPTDPNAISSYNDALHYVRFPGSNETECIQILLINNEQPPSNMSYAEIGFTSAGRTANITASSNYQIWNSRSGCIAHPGFP